jgi:hypothetical protein
MKIKVSRTDRIESAIISYMNNIQSVDKLMTDFNLTGEDVLGVIIEAKIRRRDQIFMTGKIEKQIEGMEWDYNPERDIRGMQVSY